MCLVVCVVFFFKQKTAYEMRISDWSSDVCSSDLHIVERRITAGDIDAAIGTGLDAVIGGGRERVVIVDRDLHIFIARTARQANDAVHQLEVRLSEGGEAAKFSRRNPGAIGRSLPLFGRWEEHTSAPNQ